MSVLIKNMEMPSRCYGCAFSVWSNLHQTQACNCGSYYKPCFEDNSREFYEKRADFCPLVEVSVPHGGLLDENDVINAIHDRLHELQTHKEFQKKHGDIDLLGVMPYIAKVQPVIEAEGRTDEKNAEAIETLRANYPDACYEQLREAVNAEIEALKAQDAAGDTIGRQVAIDAVHKNYDTILDFKSDGRTVADSFEDIINALPPSQPEKQHGRIFQEIVVEYPSYHTYPEYKGKPYFSIKYTENGQEFIGYGTYKPEVLSEYLKEYFMPFAQPERKRGYWKHINEEEERAKHNGQLLGWMPWYCSECGCGVGKHQTAFCPNCGADMRGKRYGKTT